MNKKTLDTPVPRALYYMNFWTPFKSLWKIFFHPECLKQSSKAKEFQNHLENLFDSNVELVPHARIGLQFILEYLQLPPLSEVIMTPINLPEMLKMIRINKLEVKFIGYQESSFNLDYKNAQLSKNTKVFLYTPISGIHIDMDELKNYCKQNNLILIQDLTQSFLGKWRGRALHSFSDYSFLSLCDLKVLHTHRGGIIQTSDKNFRSWFETKNFSWLTIPSKKYFISFVFEDLISTLLLRRGLFNYLGRFILWLTSLLGENALESLTAGRGLKIGKLVILKGFMASGNDWQSDHVPVEQRYRFSDLQAEIGIKRLKKLSDRDLKRISNAQLFYKTLEGKARDLVPHFLSDSSNLYWKTPLIVPDFIHFQRLMLKRNIDVARSNLPWLPDLLRVEGVAGREMRDRCAYVPTHYYLSSNEIIEIAKSVNLVAVKIRE